MKFNLRLVELLLVMLMVLTSCESALAPFLEYLPEGWGTTTTTTTTFPKRTSKSTTSTSSTTAKEDEEPKWLASEHSITKKEMLERYTLTREEVDAVLALLDTMVETAMAAETPDAIDSIYEEFEVAFYHIAQQMTIASIVYYCNMKDEAASERHLTTQDMFYEVQDKYTESCRTIYLDAPCGKEIFADWSEEEIQELLDFDPHTTELKKEVEALQVEYNALGSANFDEEASRIYAQIVTKNNELARYYGYDNYYDYATERVYGRDYTAEDLAIFKEYVIEYVMPTFNNLNDGWRALYDYSDYLKNQTIYFIDSPFDSDELKNNYVIEYLNSLGDTPMGVAMRDVFDSKNCIFSYNSNSHPTAFQTYMYEDETPFCLFGSKGQSSTTLVHEIGHYYAAYTNNDLNNYDLCETHSQGNEFLFIKYCEGKVTSKIYDVARYYNLFNAYYVIVCASIIDSFEQKVYSLESVEGYGAEEFDAIMDEVLAEFGKDNAWFADNLADMHDYWKNVAIDNPVYYISYAVSAVAAVEIFAIAESEEEGMGYDQAMAQYRVLVEGVTEEDGFLGALVKAGLTTPFEEETFKKIAQTLRK